MIFNKADRIRSGRFDITGRLIRRGIPVEVHPGPLGAAPEPVDHLEEVREEPAGENPSYSMPGAAAELGEKLLAMESGIRELPVEHVLIDSEKDQRRLYAMTALLGVLGAGYER